MPKNHKTPLEMLDNVIAETVLHINDFTNKPTDFTRNRKLNAQTTIKTILNMQGNSLNTELIDAFPNANDRMTASAYEQAKGKLKPSVFKYILQKYNESTEAYRKLNNTYRVLPLTALILTHHITQILNTQ